MPSARSHGMFCHDEWPEGTPLINSPTPLFLSQQTNFFIYFYIFYITILANLSLQPTSSITHHASPGEKKLTPLHTMHKSEQLLYVNMQKHFHGQHDWCIRESLNLLHISGRLI